MGSRGHWGPDICSLRFHNTQKFTTDPGPQGEVILFLRRWGWEGCGDSRGERKEVPAKFVWGFGGCCGGDGGQGTIQVLCICGSEEGLKHRS